MIKATALPGMYREFTEAIEDPTFRDAISYRIYKSHVLTEKDYYSYEHHRQYAEGISFGMLVEAKRPGAEDNTKLFYCDDEMSSAIETGCRLFEAEDKADTTLIPSKTGFVYFTRGVKLTDNLSIHGLYWYQITDTSIGEDMTVVVGFNDTINKADPVTDSWKRFFEESGDRVPDTRWMYRTYHIYDRHVKMLIPDEEKDRIENEVGGSLVTTTLSQVMHAFLLMVNQPPEVVTTSTAKLSNSKQIKKLATKNLPSEVTVIDIRHRRRSLSAAAAPGSINYSRRWYVEGHWRWQWFKDKETDKRIQKRIWINSYIKGPDDKPFVATKRVYALLK